MAFDLECAWRVAPQVALRPEPFGALAYHFGSRRLSFLKTKKLVGVVEALAENPTGRDACAAAGVSDAELGAYERALDALVASGMVVRRDEV